MTTSLLTGQEEGHRRARLEVDTASRRSLAVDILDYSLDSSVVVDCSLAVDNLVVDKASLVCRV